MAQKVALSARKMKSRQETTSLSQIVTVTAKPTISDKHLLTPTRDVFKFRHGTWDMGHGDMGPLRQSLTTVNPAKTDNKRAVAIVRIYGLTILSGFNLIENVSAFFSREKASCPH